MFSAVMQSRIEDKFIVKNESNDSWSDDSDDAYNYRCRYCGQGFCEKKSLIAHSATHNTLSEIDFVVKDEPEDDGYERRKVDANVSEYAILKLEEDSDRLASVPTTQRQLIKEETFKTKKEETIDNKRWITIDCGKPGENNYGDNKSFLFDLNNDLDSQKRKRVKTKKLLEAEEVSNRRTIASEVRHSKRMPRPIRGKFKCSLCKKVFTYRGNLKAHFMSVHKRARPHTCNLCGKHFSRKTVLKTHIRIHGSEDKRFPWRCDLCGSKFSCKQSLKNHLALHEGLVEYSCYICHKEFALKARLEQHMLVHAAPSYQCDICGHGFTYFTNIKAHIMDKHLKIKEFACRVCRKPFSRERYVKQHEETHGEGAKKYRRYLCHLCKNELLVGDNAYFSHMKCRHPDAEELTARLGFCMCANCDKSFLTTAQLARHLVTHSKDKPFRCKQCPKTFMGAPALARHSFNHSEQKPFACTNCGKGFTNKVNAVKHPQTCAARPMKKQEGAIAPYKYQIRAKSYRHSNGVGELSFSDDTNYFEIVCNRPPLPQPEVSMSSRGANKMMQIKKIRLVEGEWREVVDDSNDVQLLEVEVVDPMELEVV